MLLIKTENISDGWRKSLAELYTKGRILDDPEIFKDETLVLEIKNPLLKRTDSLFPMGAELIKEYNRYILNGGPTRNVLPEHAIYHERIFSYNGVNQIDNVINKLNENKFSKRALISLWIPGYDETQGKAPCVLLMWFRLEDNKLAMHVHMRACDAYRKLLMNLNVCSEVMKHIAHKLKCPLGKYTHIVDSFHIYNKDLKAVEETVKCIS